MLLGVVADSHGWLHPRVRDVFRNVDEILHAGDIDSERVIEDLEQIAPVVAVRGNVDRGALAARYRSWCDLEVEGHRLLLLHRGGKALQGDPQMAAVFRRVCPDIVVYGHTHLAECGWQDGVYYLNPGLGGRPKRGIRSSVALLTVEPGRVEGEIIWL